MNNPYQPESATISNISWLADGIKLFRFDFDQKIPGYKFAYGPGQFVELSLPGYGEGPFAPCGMPNSGYIELCIRDVGRLTHRLHQMKIGDKVAIRGPFGRGWPLSVNSKQLTDNSKKNLLIIVGGLGLVPLRTLILGKDKFLGKDAKIQIFYGARKPQDMLFRHEFPQWQKNGVDLKLTIDKICPDWQGCVGLVTALFDKYEPVPDSQAFLCGPPVMFKFALEKLTSKGYAKNDVYLSLERRMHCGVGVCQHCAVGPYYTCKDGPVFSWEQLKDIPDAI